MNENEYSPLAPDEEAPLIIKEDEAEPYLARMMERDFEELTLAEAIGEFFRAPWTTLYTIISIATPAPRVIAPKVSRDFLPSRPERTYETLAQEPVEEQSVIEPIPPSVLLREEESPVRGWIIVAQMAFLAAAFGVGVWGGVILADSVNPMPGVLYLGVAFVLAFIGQSIGAWNEPRADALIKQPVITPDVPVQGIHIPLLLGGIVLAVFGYLTNAFVVELGSRTVVEVRFTLVGVICWLLSILLTGMAFYRPSRHENPYDINAHLPPTFTDTYAVIIGAIFGSIRGSFRGLYRFYRNERLVFFIVLGITLFGAFFRLQHLNIMLPEMTSDHVEKLLDAQRVYNGDYQIFFANNQGREPFQMYALALLGNFIGINFMALKLLAAFEAILTLPVVFWLGREIIGERDRRFGTIFGLSLMLLLSVSYWHFVVARVALRIILTPLVVSLLLIYLMRGMRRNSRADFIKVGLLLGFGLYTYQAIRMLPVVILAAALLTLFFYIRSRRALLGYVVNFAVIFVVASVIFVPMLRYAVEYPDEFWRRANGRLFGDSLVEVRNDQGQLVTRAATLEERIGAFGQNLPILGQNMVDALLMFHLKGDVAWLHGYPNHQAMDVLTATFLIIGAGAWLAWMLRRGDAIYWLIPVTGLIMLLPSALSIALPIENPSHTRTSGAMPEVYAIAGFGLAVMLALVMRVLPRRVGVLVLIISFSLMGSLVYATNYDIVYNPNRGYRENYMKSGLPHSEGGRLMREFAETQGNGFGNVFIVSSPYWWDHRAIAIEALLPPGTWQNTIPEEHNQPKFSNLARLLREAVTRRDRYILNPDKDLLFFYSITDEAAAEMLPQWFPSGYATPVTSYMPNRDYVMYRVPALGVDRLRQILAVRGEPF